MTVWTSGPSRGPATAGHHLQDRLGDRGDVLHQPDVLHVDLVGHEAGEGREGRGVGVATVSDASGWRTRSPLALRTLSAAEQTSRARSIAATSSGVGGQGGRRPASRPGGRSAPPSALA